MDLADAPEHAAFRREFRAWLDANLTDDLKVEDASDSRIAPDRDGKAHRLAEEDVHRRLGRGLLAEIAFGDAAWHREPVATLLGA